MTAATAPAAGAAGPAAAAGPAGKREVGAAVLVNVYWHLHVAELILAGAEPREANEACWRTYYHGAMQKYVFAVLAASGSAGSWETVVRRALYPAGDPCLTGHLTAVPSRGPHKHWTTRCLATALSEDQRLLAISWDDLCRKYGPCPRACITDEHAEHLRWLSHMMWLLATGAGDLLHCARVAHDRAAGRPARRREPADPEWLAAELDGALTATWDALRHADDGAGRSLWDPPPPAVRPVADGGDPEAERLAGAAAAARRSAEPQPSSVMHGKSRGVTKPPHRPGRRKRHRP